MGCAGVLVNGIVLTLSYTIYLPAYVALLSEIHVGIIVDWRNVLSILPKTQEAPRVQRLYHLWMMFR
jgi:hypothetical protein